MNFIEDCLYFIFPKICGICGKIGKDHLCEKCLKNMQSSSIFSNRIDDYTKDNTKYFDYHAYIFSYKEIIREKIIQYKFENKAYLSNMFYEFFIKNEKICGFLKKYDIVQTTKNRSATNQYL